MTKSTRTVETVVPEFLSGGGEMGQRIRDFDWSNTSLGPVNSWPHSLRTCIRIMLDSRQPIWIGWGKDLIKLYNDPYKDIVRGKHPWAMGAPASEVWKEIWNEIEPMLEQVMERDTGTYVESQLLIMERNGYPEETYYTFSYTPIPGDNGGTAGMICFNTDDTERIINDRQLRTLTQLGKALTDSRLSEDVISRTIATLAQNPHDFPFALFRSIRDKKAVLAESTEAGNSPDILQSEIDLEADNVIAQTLRQALETRQPQLLEDLTSTVGYLPKGAWTVSPEKAIVLPINSSTGAGTYGLLKLGINPYRLLDEKFRSFIKLIGDQVATSFGNVHALEEERKRSLALAEIDKAKTIFFSNISHEFRTPLTLLLGPIQDVINDKTVDGENRNRLELAHRNAIRMQKLVNTLLEFSRIEAGRIEGKFHRVDICKFTGDLASTFRSSIERSGMKLITSCGKITANVYVDPEMWERIILNLVSNAFKYSRSGEIRINTSQVDGLIQVTVTDTGVGIPADQLERIFDRFYRVANSDGRSQEGTGIGLAMVKELVKLHHGTITVASEMGKGSTFTVSIPAGKDHLRKEKIVEDDFDTAHSTPRHADAFLQEALKWDQSPSARSNRVHKTQQAKLPVVVFADDNADMRDYVERLLSKHFNVTVACDGEEAFIRMLDARPDLLLSDVMMPRLDGFGLLKKVRNHPELRNTPVIFLSARAGEEAKVEGLDAGADDYLVKPFSARELLVRVANMIRIHQVRMETEKQFYQLFVDAPAHINLFKGADFRFELFHPRTREMIGDIDFTGMPLLETVPELAGQEVIDIMNNAYREGETINKDELLIKFRSPDGKLMERYFNYTIQPWRDLKGNIQGVLSFAIDVTEQVRARMAIEENEQKYRELSGQLEEIVDQRTIELRRSNEDLQQFAHVASHDLKEPVRKLRTFIGRLDTEFGSLIPDKGRMYIEKIRNASTRTTAMIDGVLKYSSLSETEAEIDDVDMNELFLAIENDLEVMISEKNAVIRRDKLPTIQGAEVLLYQLFYNLINNSLKFVKDRPEVTISSRAVTKDGIDYAVITVRDNGIGFDQRFASQIFNAFSRLNSKDKYEGTGLGLSLCKKIAERHRGTISAEGKQDAGATFTVILPVQQTQTRI